MATRTGARRHKGSNRQNWARSRSAVDLVDPRAAEVMRYWRLHRDPAHGDWYELVYFIQEDDEDDAGAIKIGRAQHPLKRLSAMQCGNPRRLRIKRVVFSGLNVEAHIQGYWWGSAGLRGEWFGRGRQAAILANADVIAAAQIEAHKQRVPWDEIREQVVLRALFAEREEAA